MIPYTIVAIRDRQELKETAANWFHNKWRVPVQAYLDSMSENDGNKAGVPQWYLALDESGGILGGLGVIENDFHKRPDLAPNIAAVYVEEHARMQGISRALLDHVCAELKAAFHELFTHVGPRSVTAFTPDILSLIERAVEYAHSEV